MHSVVHCDTNRHPPRPEANLVAAVVGYEAGVTKLSFTDKSVPFRAHSHAGRWCPEYFDAMFTEDGCQTFEVWPMAGRNAGALALPIGDRLDVP